MLWVSSAISGGALRIWKPTCLFPLSTAERQRQRTAERWRERGKREREGLLSCCVVPCDCEGAAPPRLTAILLLPASSSSSSPPSFQSLLWPVSGKCHCSVHTHTRFQNVGKVNSVDSASPQNANVAHKRSNHRCPDVFIFKTLWEINAVSKVSFSRWCSFVCLVMVVDTADLHSAAKRVVNY